MMKRTLLIGALVALSACQQTPAQQVKKVPVTAGENNIAARGVTVWKDPETGCEYLLYFSSGITARYARGGSSYEQQHVKGCSFQ